jgi:hypothetical protein
MSHIPPFDPTLSWLYTGFNSHKRSMNSAIGLKPSILRQSGIWGQVDEAVLNKVQNYPGQNKVAEKMNTSIAKYMQLQYILQYKNTILHVCDGL